MARLYAIADLEALERAGLPLVGFVEAVLCAHPSYVQLRDKRGPSRRTLEALRSLVAPCRAAGVPLVANDRLDLALASGADALHLGQTDLPVTDAARVVRERGAALRLGVSTHTDSDLDQALGEYSLSYAAIGPIFSTTNKTGPEGPAPVVGLEALVRRSARAKALRPDIELVAIGGITLERAPFVGNVVEHVAVIGALLPPAGLTGASALAGTRETAGAFARALAG
jgi:thiamine-phosphate pyrophosphorylase